jgi:hypothetical protein
MGQLGALMHFIGALRPEKHALELFNLQGQHFSVLAGD